MYIVWIYFAMFVIFTALHLYASYIKRDGLRAPTKPIILLAILGMYLTYAHCKGVEPNVFLVIAILTSWLGDVLLIPKGVKWFTIGGISFWISHAFFIKAYYDSGVQFSKINPIVIIGIAVAYVIAVFIIFKKLKKSLPKALFYPMFAYLLTNGAMNCFAWYRFLSGACTPISGIVTAIGATLFFISDSSLFFVRFDKNSKLKTHFLVMTTYSIGEFLIILGFMLMI